MEEFEPRKKIKIFTKEFYLKYSYVFIIGLVLLLGISYSYTFFVQNKKIASGSITTANLTINFTDRTINASNLSVPTDNQEGLSEYTKSLTISNTTAADGKAKLTLTRTSGLNLTDLSYAIVVNGAVQEIGDVPANGEIIETAVMGNESIEVEVRLWPKTTYSGSETTFVGEITPDIKYLGPVASSRDDLVGKYVDFNCNSGTCEKWQIVEVEDGRLVLTKQTDYSGATSRTNSNKYDSTLGLHDDDNLITSVSTDGKNVYLRKTVKISGGSGTTEDPYVLTNTIFNEEDKKIIALITYKDGTTTVGTQNVYYNETNYISQVLNDPAFQYWDDGTNHYYLGDTINISTDINLTAVTKLNSTITLTNNNVNLTYGTNGENAYTYDGDGTLSCTSSDTTKVTCSVDTTNHKIVLTPVAVTTTDVTITVSGVDGTNYFAPTSQTFTASVAKGTLECPSTATTSKTFNNNTQTYDGNACPTGSSRTSASGINVGDYYATCTADANHQFSGTCNVGKMTIVAAEATCPSISGTTNTYNNTARTINVSGGANGETQYSTDNSTWSTTKPTRTAAGTTTVYVREYATGNYSTKSCGSANIVINPAAASFSCSNKTYTGSEQTACTCTNCTLGTGCSATNAGSYTCNATANENYTLTTTSIGWTMNKATGWITINTKPSSVSCGGTTTVTVNGSHGGTISCSSNNTSYVTCSGTTITGNASGSATVTCTSAATTNYNAASTSWQVTTGACTSWHYNSKYSKVSFCSDVNGCNIDCKSSYGSSTQWSCVSSNSTAPSSASLKSGLYCWCYY